MEEIVVNIHMHTRYSDGSGSHADIARAAQRAGIDVAIVTDHNIHVAGMEGYHEHDHRRVLVLVGEEVHDRSRDPQKNHLLILGAGRSLTAYAAQPQQVIHQAALCEALSFIAHPVDPALPAFGEPDISWEDWQVRDYTGIELWNGFSELKTAIRGYLGGLFYALFPNFLARGPIPAVLERWDTLLAAGNRVVAIGGSDAHALNRSLGPIRRQVFPYEYHFRAINNHLLVPNLLTGSLPADRKMILTALAQGRSFIGYDLPAPTHGFRFTAQGIKGTATIGDEITLQDGLNLQIKLPSAAECRLIKDGQVLRAWNDRAICTYIANQPGIYRVEAYIRYLGRRRGWIFSNPIYVR